MDCEILLHDVFMGEDAMIRVSFAITDWGSPATGHFGLPEHYDPGSDADWTIYDISIQIMLENGDGAEWFVDPNSRQFRLIANSADVVNAIVEQIAEEEECRPYWHTHRSWSAA